MWHRKQNVEIKSVGDLEKAKNRIEEEIEKLKTEKTKVEQSIQYYYQIKNFPDDFCENCLERSKLALESINDKIKELIKKYDELRKPFELFQWMRSYPKQQSNIHFLKKNLLFYKQALILKENFEQAQGKNDLLRMHIYNEKYIELKRKAFKLKLNQDVINEIEKMCSEATIKRKEFFSTAISKLLDQDYSILLLFKIVLAIKAQNLFLVAFKQNIKPDEFQNFQDIIHKMKYRFGAYLGLIELSKISLKSDSVQKKWEMPSKLKSELTNFINDCLKKICELIEKENGFEILEHLVVNWNYISPALSLLQENNFDFEPKLYNLCFSSLKNICLNNNYKGPFVTDFINHCKQIKKNENNFSLSSKIIENVLVRFCFYLIQSNNFLFDQYQKSKLPHYEIISELKSLFSPEEQRKSDQKPSVDFFSLLDQFQVIPQMILDEWNENEFNEKFVNIILKGFFIYFPCFAIAYLWKESEVLNITQSNGRHGPEDINFKLFKYYMNKDEILEIEKKYCKCMLPKNNEEFINQIFNEITNNISI